MMVAAGPFTLDDDLLFQPLSALLEVVVEERPDVLILVGRFWIDTPDLSLDRSSMPITPSSPLGKSPRCLMTSSVNRFLLACSD